MFVYLEEPHLKGISVFVVDLAGDEGFESREFTPWDADRSRANCAINRANELLGKERMPAFFSLFNQFRWEGTTGWEYWSGQEKDGLVLKHGLLVAAALKVPLHVHIGVIDRMIAAAASAGIKFDYDFGRRIENPNRRDTGHTNRRLDQEEFLVLTNVVLPSGMPAPPKLD